jgi:anthranilate phosphoribosyltransferase
MVRAVLAGEQGARRDIVLLNAGGALYAAGAAHGVPEGIRMAREGLDSGAALAKLEGLAERSQRLGRGWFREA